MSAEPRPEHERDCEPTDPAATLRELLGKFPKEERVAWLDEISLQIELNKEFSAAARELFREAYKADGVRLIDMSAEYRTSFLKEVKADSEGYRQMTETEKKAYWREREYRRALADAGEVERETLLSHIQVERAKYACMTENERREYWQREEAAEALFDQMLSKAVPLTREFFKQWENAPVGTFRTPTEDDKKRYADIAASYSASYGEENLRFGVGFIERFLESLAEVAEPLKSYVKIDRYLRILLGDAYLCPSPVTLQGQLSAKGTEKKPTELSFPELMEALCAPADKESWMEIVLPTLDMIFEQRYGWPEGTAATKTITELCLALEHAVEHDDKSKPSIWDMT